MAKNTGFWLSLKNEHCKSKQRIPFNYSKIEETISPKVLKLIGDWILKYGK